MDTRPAAAIERRSIVLGIVLLVFAVSVLAAARPSLRLVRLASEAGAMVVTLEADGALPSPQIGVLDNPPRIYLDFPGVGTRTRGLRAAENSLVRGVRVAVNQAEPLVTRVVIDLAQGATHSIDAGLRDKGVISIVVSNPASQAAGIPAQPAVTQAPPLPAVEAPAREQSLPPRVGQTSSVPPPAATPGPPPAAAATPAPPMPSLPPAPALPSAAPPPAENAAARARTFDQFAREARVTVARAPEKDVIRYLKDASAPLQRIENLRPVLLLLDALSAVPERRLNEVAQEFDAIRRTLARIEPPQTLRSAHDDLLRTCALGGAAARARLDRTAPDDSARAWNAASAAAGALMLLERVRAELGVGVGPR